MPDRQCQAEMRQKGEKWRFGQACERHMDTCSLAMLRTSSWKTLGHLVSCGDAQMPQIGSLNFTAARQPTPSLKSLLLKTSARAAWSLKSTEMWVGFGHFGLSLNTESRFLQNLLFSLWEGWLKVHLWLHWGWGCRLGYEETWGFERFWSSGFSSLAPTEGEYLFWQGNIPHPS